MGFALEELKKKLIQLRDAAYSKIMWIHPGASRDRSEIRAELPDEISSSVDQRMEREKHREAKRSMKQ